MPNLRQPNFSTGEVSKSCYGRTDDPRYASSLRTCKNFLPIQHGALVNRPGSYVVKLPGGNGVSLPNGSRLKSFIFSDTQSVVLYFIDSFIFFAQNGQYVDDAPGSGVAYFILSPYLQADLARLTFAQSGDVVEIRHPNYPRKRLSRFGMRFWSLTSTPLGPPAGFFPASTAMAPNGFGGDSATAYSGVQLYVAGDFVNNGAGTFICTVSVSGVAPPTSGTGVLNAINNTAGSLYWQLAVDAGHIPQIWEWVITAKYKDSNGVLYESLPTPVGSGAYLADSFTVLSADRPNRIQWTAPAAPGFNYKLVAYGVYRGRNGLRGWMDDVDPTVLTYKDDGHAPNYSIQPPAGTNPFLIADGANTATTVKNPGVVTFHEQRLIEARTDAKPNHFFGSWINDFTRFDQNLVQQLDNNAFDFGLSSQRLEEIRAIVSLRQLVMLTGAGEWSAEGSPGNPITPTSVRARKHSDHGSSYLQPLVHENALVFNTAKGNYVRDLIYNFRTDTYEGIELTTLARHLFDGFTIKDWCLCTVPYPIIWVLRSDGLLLSCTYDRAAGVVAWAQHPQAVGQIKSICSVPEGTEDVVYLVRNLPSGSDALERQQTRLLGDLRYCLFLDSAVKFDGHGDGVVTMHLIIPTGGFAAGTLATCISSVAMFSAANVGTSSIIFDPEGAAVKAEIVGFNAVASVSVMFDQTLTPAQVAAWSGTTTTNWALATGTVAVAHLVGQTVNVLADGFMQGPYVVDVTGSIAISPPAVVVQAGLPYNSDAELMDAAPQEIKGKVATVRKAIWEVVDSLGFETGEDFNNLTPAKTRRTSEALTLPSLITDQVPVNIKSSFNSGGRVVIRQSDPLPLTVVGAIRELVVGGEL